MSEPPPKVSTPTERRHFSRRKCRFVLEIEWGSSTLRGVVRDIGPRGLFVELAPPLWVGATFFGRLMLNPVLQLNCTVCRIEPGKGIAVVGSIWRKRVVSCNWKRFWQHCHPCDPMSRLRGRPRGRSMSGVRVDFSRRRIDGKTAIGAAHSCVPGGYHRIRSCQPGVPRA